MPIRVIGLDADDTLWRTNIHFELTEARFAELLAPYAPPQVLRDRLRETEIRNLRLYGYGAKGFTLSMIETALGATGGQVPGAVVGEILAQGRALLETPVEPLPGVRDTLEALARDRRLVLITKGDLLHQEQKLAASGLGELFSAVEIVSDKTEATYARILGAMEVEPDAFLMVGDSLRSDVLPALKLGAFAAHVPHDWAWAHEHAEVPIDHPRYLRLDALTELPERLARLQAEAAA